MDLHGDGAGADARDRLRERAAMPALEILRFAERRPGGGSVLLLYGLHPLDFETRVRRAIEKVRPSAALATAATWNCSASNDGAVRIRVRGQSDSAFTARTVKSAVEEEPSTRPLRMPCRWSLLGLENCASPGFVPLEKIGPVTPARRVRCLSPERTMTL